MVSNDIKDLSDRGPDQKKKMTEETGDITTDHESFEISIDFFFIFYTFGDDRRCK
jgi:hypothetical protein